MIIIQPLPFLEHVVVDMPLELGYKGHVEMRLNLILVIVSIVKCLLLARYMFWHNRTNLSFIAIYSLHISKHTQREVLQTIIQQNLQDILMRELIHAHNEMSLSIKFHRFYWWVLSHLYDYISILS